MSGHVFVDESKQRDYLFVAAGVMPGDLAGARRAVRAHVMPGQRRLHLRKESDARRNAIVDAVASIGATRNHLQPRRPGHHMLVLEQDDPLLWWDQQHSSGSSARSDAAKTPRCEHRRAEHELHLAVPDAIAWCWAKGGHWRDRVQPP